MKKIVIFLLAAILSGCAQGRLDILSQEGEVLGSCSANFNWHWYGAKDSVGYLLYLCAKGHLEAGKVISDPTIFENDYSLPAPPEGQAWNKQNAYKSFKSGNFSEQKYGYILAAIEYEFMVSKDKARKQLESGAITKTQYEQQVQQAETLFKGE